ncbi:polymer-forming cytoskeletal protein, partial [Candidatus Parcubacteria bacterium]
NILPDIYDINRFVERQEPIRANFLSAGFDIDLKQSAVVDGDLLILGADININAPVAGDVRIIGNKVKINSEIEGNASIFGSLITIDSDTNIAGDLSITGGDANINGVIKGDVIIKSKSATINGVVEGNVISYSPRLRWGDTAKVNGTFSYIGSSKDIDNKEIPAANIEFVSPETLATNKINFPLKNILAVIKTISLLILSGSAMLLAPKFALSIAQETRKKFFRYWILGVVFLILLPVAAMIVTMTVIGIPAALAVGSIYILMLVGAFVYSPIIAGYMAQKLFIKSDKVKWFTVVVGVFVLVLLSLLSWLTWLAAMAVYVASLGALADRLLKFIMKSQ